MVDNMPAGDVWYLQDVDDKSINYGKKFRFNFEEFKAEKIRTLIKSYVWHNYQTGTITLRAIYNKYISFKQYNIFASQNEIINLSELTANDADNFVSHLRTTVSANTGKPLKYGTQETIFSALKSIIYWGQVFTPELVPNQ